MWRRPSERPAAGSPAGPPVPRVGRMPDVADARGRRMGRILKLPSACWPETPVAGLPGVGPARARGLGRLGIVTASDLLLHLPRRYEDTRDLVAGSGAAGRPGADGPGAGARGPRPSQPEAAHGAGRGHPGGRRRQRRRHLVQPAVHRQPGPPRHRAPGQRQGGQRPARADLPEPPLRAGQQRPPPRRAARRRLPGDRGGHLRVPPRPDRAGCCRSPSRCPTGCLPRSARPRA